jgi:diaminopimelate decarboxylase
MELYCDDAPLRAIASECGTPCYVYSARGIVARYRAYDEAFGDLPHQVCYAVKANSNLAILRLLAQLGAGFDIVSAGELYRVLQAGGDPETVVFSGVGKTEAEIEYALDRGIHSFNCESEAELEALSSIASRRNQVAQVSIRVNPDVDASTHPYISTGLKDNKFGIDIDEAGSIYDRVRSLPGLAATGVSCHIGSQMLDPAPVMAAVEKVVTLAGQLIRDGAPIEHLDLGGGLGIAYTREQRTPHIRHFIQEMRTKVRDLGLAVMIEPGRSIVGQCGVLLSSVVYRKRNGKKEFVILDAAMNDLIRPSLYSAHHEIWPVIQKEAEMLTADIVGPVCETGDFLARNRELPTVEPGELVSVMTAGAYGFVLSSNYNSRPRVAEVLVDGAEWRVVRKRETFEDLVRGEEQGKLTADDGNLTS